jgi:uncharacterized protein (DUF58 family)
VIRVLLAGVALVLIALTFDATPLLVPGVALAALGTIVPAWIRLAARRASVTRRLHGERVVEDQPLEATIEVRSGPLGLPGGEVLDDFVGSTLRLNAGPSARRADGRATVRVVARFPRRGQLSFRQPVLWLRDPLGLAPVRRLGEGRAEQLLVLPRTEPVSWAAEESGDRPDSPALALAAEAFAATEVDGLRPYRPGAPASRIHWPAVAKGAGLLERRLRTDAASGPLVVLDARGPGSDELLDAAVRAAASLALELARRTGCELLLPGERRPIRIGPDLAAWPGAHARLALVDGGPDAPAPMLGTRPHLGPIYYVVADELGSLDRLRFETRMRSVVVAPAALALGAPHATIFEVAGCRAFALDGRRAHERERGAVA